MSSKYDGAARLKQIALSLGNKNGIYSAALMDRALSYKIKKIPTGIFMLDWYTDGGIPIDRITRISGAKDSYKTTTLFKIMANAQNCCRFCKSPFSYNKNVRDCQCPSPRYTLTNKNALQFMDYDTAIGIIEGKLPAGSIAKGNGYVFSYKDLIVTLEPMARCQPFQTLFIETEHKMDSNWAKQNGVDTELVIVMGCDWAEKLIDSLEELLYTGEVDIVFVDTISMLNSMETISKGMGQRESIASKAKIKQRLLEKIISSQFSRGLMPDNSITVVLNSQIRTKGIGGFKTTLGPSDGHCVDHLVSLDLFFAQKKFTFKHSNYASEGEYQFTIKKNHTGGASGISGQFKVSLDPFGDAPVGETNDVELMIEYGRKVGIIKEQSKGYCIGQKSFNTILEMKKFLLLNKKIYSRVRSSTIMALQKMRLDSASVSKKKKAEIIPNS